MKPTLPGLCVMLSALWLPALHAAPPFDINQPQSPALPPPNWLKIIDQGQNDPRLKGYMTPAGIKVEIVADFPTVVNPVGMTFDDEGTLFVLEWRHDPDGNWNEFPEPITYKNGTKRTIATMKKSVKDVVKILVQEKSPLFDGYRVILEEELPSSVLVHDGWLYVSGRGTVRRYCVADLSVLQDPQPKGVARQPKPEIIAKGFCGFHHHQVSGLTIGNDGWLYITSGDDDNIVEGSDGSRATALRTGAVFRCRPDGSRMHVWSIGYRNPYRDVAFDARFNMFHVDNDNEDGTKFMGCRLMHVAEESDFGWRLRTGARCCAPDRLRGAAFGELPGKLKPMLKTGRGAPAGLLIYNDTRFPEPYRGMLYYPDVYRRLIRAYHVAPRGSTFAVVQEFELMKSDDPLFRPCQMVVGPDGAMYVCDWRTNSGGAGQLSGDGKHGRIYRLSWTGDDNNDAIALQPLNTWAKLVRQSDEKLIETLSDKDFSIRQRAQRELVRRGIRNRPALLRLFADGTELVEPRIAALGALQSMWNEDVEAVFAGHLRDGDKAMRRLIAEALSLNARPGNAQVINALFRNLEDQDPAARRAIYLAYARIGGAEAADALGTAFKFDEGKDEYLTDGLVRALERLGKPGIAKLMDVSESGVETEHDRVLEAFVGMRTRPAMEAIPALMKYPHLTIKQRADLIRSYGNYLFDPPISLQPALDYMLAHPREEAPVKLAALELLTGSAELKKDPNAAGWLIGLLDETDSAVRLAAIGAVGETRVARAVPQLIRLLEDGERADTERTALIKALQVLRDKSALAALKKILGAEKAGTVEKRKAQQMLQREALRALAALDAPVAQESARKLLDQSDDLLQNEVVQLLCQQPDGARLIAERFRAGKLPKALLPQIADGLRRHAGKHPELAPLLTDVMKDGLLLTLAADEIKRVEQLVKSQGNPQRGRALFLDSKTLACVNCHRLEGVGGSVGPDLSRIWDTHSVAKIMETILDPSKEIKEGFTTYVATTKQGQTFTGLKVAQTAEEVVIRDANAREVRIGAKDLDTLTASKKSLMPDNAVVQLSFGQFIDLVAFLKDRGTQESLHGLALDFQAIGPVPREDEPFAFWPKAGAEPPRLKKDAKLGWQRLAANPKGYVDLRPLFPFDAKKPAAAYALTFVHAPRAQTAKILVGASSPIKIWQGETLVFRRLEARPARPDEKSEDVDLKEGWNAFVIHLNDSGGELGFYLRFAGGQGLRVSSRPSE